MICDGPRGPIYQMKPGAPYMAIATGATVVPATAAAERAWVFRSWDRFHGPQAVLARAICCGATRSRRPPIPHALDDFSQLLEADLNALTAQADALAAARVAASTASQHSLPYP